MTGTLVLATRNEGKAREFQEWLKPLGYTVFTAQQAGYDSEPEETGSTFRDNALIKAQAVAPHVQFPVLADDSGLEVETLRGAPGIFSARYAGNKATDADNRQKLLNALETSVNRRARFVCVLCWLEPGKSPVFFEGICRGSIPQQEKGMLGFGYDPVFIPDGESRTLAEMPLDFKNRISHRGRALSQFVSFLSDWRQ